MSYIKHLLASKGATNILSRAFMIYRRFGFTRKKSQNALQRILEITARHDCTPSFFVTAELLDNHWELIQQISENGTHIGLHGCHHIDYGCMSESAQRNDIAKGLSKFQERGLRVSGFRAPFLRANQETAKAVVANGIAWLSHSTMLFDGNAGLKILDEANGLRHFIDAFYIARYNANEPSVPSWTSDCLDIPVSLPDDELLIDRLGIRAPQELTSAWLEMLNSSRRKGELFNFIFHPERTDLIAQPLDTLLKEAISYGDVWVSSLDDIGRWWRERSGFSFEIEASNHDNYRVAVKCTPRASIVLQHPGGELEFLTPKSSGTFRVQSNLKPVVGVSPSCNDKDVHYLRNEGFVIEPNEDPNSCAFVLDGFCAENSRQLLKLVNQARGPLLRFWRWPNQFRSALAITADIDAITIWDFFRRARHFRKASSH